MATKEQELAPAIIFLEKAYVEAQRVANDKLAVLNMLRHEAGLPPRPLGIDAEGGGEASTLTQIKRDTFYGKKQMTAMREYLEMRRAQGDGPATPREILDALKAGGYKFEAKSDDIALVGLRALLRKASNVFHKLPGTSAYGLLVWYPNAKPQTSDDDSVAGRAHSGGKRKRGRPPGKAKGKRGRPPNAQKSDENETEAAADTKPAAA